MALLKEPLYIVLVLYPKREKNIFIKINTLDEWLVLQLLYAMSHLIFVINKYLHPFLIQKKSNSNYERAIFKNASKQQSFLIRLKVKLITIF